MCKLNTVTNTNSAVLLK